MKKGRLSAVLLVAALLLSFMTPASAAEFPELSGTAETGSIRKYGNIVLSITQEELFAAGYVCGDVLTVRFPGHTLELPLCSNYSDVDSGKAGVFARDEDLCVVLAINMGDFASVYGLAVKTTHEDNSYEWNWAEGITGPVCFTLSMKEVGGYRDEYLLHQLSYSDVRGDYPDLSDAEFANFREVTTTGMGGGILFRTASPINPERNRSVFADEAIRAAGVTVVMNLADDEASARSHAGFEGSYYAGTAFIALNMGVDFTAAEFREKLAEGLRFFAGHPGVYAVHCLEGKDRTGFVIALLECFMGASLEEVAEDYMLTFSNYYGVTPGDARYDTILGSGILKSLAKAFETEDLEHADLSACAAAYLEACGLTAEELAALRNNLSGSREPVSGEQDGILTRGGFIGLLFQIDGGEGAEPIQTAFTDILPEGELAPAVSWAVENGIVRGYGDGRFGPDDPMTLEQMTVILWRRCGQPAGETERSAYGDGVSAWAREAFAWALDAGVIAGGPDALPDPRSAVTRAEAERIVSAHQPG